MIRRLLPLACYLLIAVGMTFPLVFHLDTHIPGSGGDGPNFLWRLWWTPHALFERGVSPWVTDAMFYPQQAPLVFDTLMPLYGVVTWPLQLLVGQTVAYNLLVIGGLAAAAYFTYQLCLRLTGHPEAAFIGGLVFGFSPYVLIHMWGHLNLITVWPLPLFCLLLLNVLETRQLLWSAAAGALLGATAYLDYQYAVFLGLLLLAVGLGVVAAERRQALRLLPVTGVLAGIAGVCVLPLVPPVLDAIAAGLSPSGRLSDTEFWSGDLLGFFLPSTLRWGVTGRPLFVAKDFQGIGDIEGVTYLGAGALLLAGVGLLRAGPPRLLGPRFWALVAVAFCSLVLGAHLHVAGVSQFEVFGAQIEVPMPYALLHQVPIIGTTRVPTRFVAVSYLAVAVLTAFGFRAVSAAVASVRWARGAVAVTGLLIVLEVGVAPLQLRDVRVPEFYPWLAAQPDAGPLLTLPVQLVAGPSAAAGADNGYIQSYERVHQQPITNGHVSRGDPALVEEFMAQPVFNWLTNPLSRLPDAVLVDPDVFRRHTLDVGLRYVVLHKRELDAISVEVLRRYFQDVMGQELAWEDADVLAYRLGPVRPAELDAAERFLADMRPETTLVAPENYAEFTTRTPVVEWAPAADGKHLYEVQVCKDPGFQNAFLYYETIDGLLANPPNTYRIPDQYPLDRGVAYYWRVRVVEEGRLSVWTPPGAFSVR